MSCGYGSHIQVGVGNQNGVRGIPYYPFNPQGAINWGDTTGVDFGTWGGGASTTSGVGDFWQLSDEAGANWYEGQYGRANRWQVPLLPFVSGSSGTQVHAFTCKHT